MKFFKLNGQLYIPTKLLSVFLLFTFVLLFLFENSHGWLQDRRPRIFGHRLSRAMLSARSKKVQRKILQYHNYFRANVYPQASNMLEMSWHPEAAEKAQYWADSCQLLTHDSASDRYLEKYGPCGQNIFVSTHKVPWFFAIKTWNLEHLNFTYGSSYNDLGVVGHYTQLVWASSHKVGCGFSKCHTRNGKVFFNYICNYCPIGNYMQSLGQPYQRGPKCSDCPSSCRARTQLCTNSCPVTDLWVNCRDLARKWHDWLCKDRTKEGLHRRKHCRATCSCQNKILPIYTFDYY